MRKVLLSSLFAMSALTGITAQEVVRGVVLDRKNEPVPGVRVEVVGGTESVMTDIDGVFQIEVPNQTKKLRFVYVGNKPIERKISPEMTVRLGGGWASHTSGYRGFFNFLGGFGTGGAVNVYAGDASITNLGKYTFACGFDTSHGYQINKHFYVGLGGGIQCLMVYHDTDYGNWVDSGMFAHGPMIQGYADFRWDYNITNKTSPYAGIKLGWQMVGINDNMYDSYWFYNNKLNLESKYQGGFLLMPSVGMRVAIGKKRGMNLGVAYNILVKRKFVADYYFENEYPEEIVNSSGRIKLGPLSGGVAMLNIGFDF